MNKYFETVLESAKNQLEILLRPRQFKNKCTLLSFFLYIFNVFQCTFLYVFNEIQCIFYIFFNVFLCSLCFSYIIQEIHRIMCVMC